MTKHTAGPWRAVQASNSGQVHILAEVNGYDRAISMDIWNDCDEQEANVRLIAAAPDLLDALQWSTFWLEGCLKCEAYTWDADQREAAEEALKNSLAALAKARGEA